MCALTVDGRSVKVPGPGSHLKPVGPWIDESLSIAEVLRAVIVPGDRAVHLRITLNGRMGLLIKRSVLDV